MKPMEQSLDKPLRQVLVDLQGRITGETHYFGVKTLKNPLDFWVYREMIYDHRPDVVIEIGNFNGGSALAFAHILDLMDHGVLIGLDLDHNNVPEHVKEHPRITFVQGDATENFERVRSMIPEDARVLIFEDSAHTYQNTLNILNAYEALIQPGDYIVIEDTICHHGLNEGPSPGGYEAVEEFVSSNPNFEIDREKENFGITWNPKGFVRRRGAAVKGTIVQEGVVHTKTSSLKIALRKLYIQVTPPIIVAALRKIRGSS